MNSMMETQIVQVRLLILNINATELNITYY